MSPQHREDDRMPACYNQYLSIPSLAHEPAVDAPVRVAEGSCSALSFLRRLSHSLNER
jgi:hypothetical protein